MIKGVNDRTANNRVMTNNIRLHMFRLCGPLPTPMEPYESIYFCYHLSHFSRGVSGLNVNDLGEFRSRSQKLEVPFSEKF